MCMQALFTHTLFDRLPHRYTLIKMSPRAGPFVVSVECKGKERGREGLGREKEEDSMKERGGWNEVKRGREGGGEGGREVGCKPY